jgi:HEPN domain-containing protein
MSESEAVYEAWLAKAANDVLNIENNIRSERVPWDTVCFHAQQAAEKTLKGFLAFHGQPPMRTHNLVAVLAGCRAFEPSLADLESDCRRLSASAVPVRYPEGTSEPEEQQARELIAAMKRIRERVLPLVGRRPEPE